MGCTVVFCQKLRCRGDLGGAEERREEAGASDGLGLKMLDDDDFGKNAMHYHTVLDSSYPDCVLYLTPAFGVCACEGFHGCFATRKPWPFPAHGCFHGHLIVQPQVWDAHEQMDAVPLGLFCREEFRFMAPLERTQSTGPRHEEGLSTVNLCFSQVKTSAQGFKCWNVYYVGSAGTRPIDVHQWSRPRIDSVNFYIMMERSGRHAESFLR